jgi:hypothetical protein
VSESSPPAPQVSKARAGSADSPRTSWPREVDHERIIAEVLKPLPKRLGVTHWSSRLLGARLNVSNATGARAWREYGVQPWRSQTFEFSIDPSGRQGHRITAAAGDPNGSAAAVLHRRTTRHHGAPHHAAPAAPRLLGRPAHHGDHHPAAATPPWLTRGPSSLRARRPTPGLGAGATGNDTRRDRGAPLR